MARIDDYVQAREIAAKKLAAQSLDAIEHQSGFTRIDEQTLGVPFLNRTYHIQFPSCVFTDTEQIDQEVPIQEQVLILHYLMAENPPQPTQSWVAYREIKGASFYFSAFTKRAIDPLKKVFGNHLDGFRQAASRLNGAPIENGDAGFEFRVFPKIPIQLILWEGDDEFPAEANILFEKTISQSLSPEDIAWVAGMLVYRLMALAHT